MSRITTHVLDTSLGRPAAGVSIRLERVAPNGPEVVGRGATDDDGRLRDLMTKELTAGRYRLVFDTAAYFQTQGVTGFYPEVVIDFDVRDPAQHYHVPVLLSPFGYSTYRGS